ncbi:MAG TPA: FliM/FliN family flagellar motor switch protein [Anaeromyxobacteraceae bacterium]|nr:FliM/FliN family flagellar motor switch protein [Anaeromyxobacteraceae bacterium]
MTPPADPLAALAAALFPGRAAALLSRRLGGEGVTVPGAPRGERLAALAAALRPPPPDGGGSSPSADDGRTIVRLPHGEAHDRPADLADPPPARPLLAAEGVLPFPIPAVAPGLLHVDGHLLALGARAARAAEAGLSSVLGGEVRLRGRLLPGLPDPGGVALVPIELTALADRASIAVERAFASRLAERVAGGSGRPRHSTALEPAERAVMELAVLGALDAIAAETGIESALAPRLGSRGGPSSAGACVELTISAGGATGRAFLVLPAAALEALPRPDEPPAGAGDVPVPATLISGSATLPSSDVEALSPGDVLVLDGDGAGPVELRLPGGASLSGELADGGLAVRGAEPGGPMAVPGSAPVRIEVELATVAVPLRELARIAPGAVLPLGLDRRGRVRLRLRGAPLAEAELVEVEGAVGVRILSIRGRE